ncbi:RICIN domain-containing protein [Colwellia sp. RE-S-Sl-9]
MEKSLTLIMILGSSTLTSYSFAQDQCNTTNQCVTTYGNQATDCRDSASSNSICMCGTASCDSIVSPPPLSEGSVFLRKRNASSFAIDGGNGGANNQNVYIWSANTANVNQAWVEIDRGNGFFSYQKQDTNYCLDGGDGGSNGQNVRLWTCSDTNQSQHWNKVNISANNYRLEKRNASGYSIDGGNGGANGQNLYLWSSNNTNQNQHWTFSDVNSDGSSDILGRFDKSKDLLLCNYDGKPDEDDLHSVAGLATMLSDARFSGVQIHCTAGAYGIQGGTFLEENNLFNLAFGDRWASAHNNYNNAVDQAYNKVATTLNAGGDIWVAEAGQSDFTADVVRKVKSEMPSINTNNRIHVVQHSDWNEDQTTPADLTYTKNNTDYNKIADGNSQGNGTPGLASTDGGEWTRATSDTQVGPVWTEARAAALRWMGINWDNEKIKSGGMDFSDTVEPMWIFGFEAQTGGITGFFDAYL